MKYLEMIDKLKSYRDAIQENHKEKLFEHIYNGISEFGKVYVNPSNWMQDIKVRRMEYSYHIEINERLWINLAPLLYNDFYIHEINKDVSVIVLK